MNVALVTPFTSHLPNHPASYLGYGAAVLKRHCETDVIDLNAELYFKHRGRLKEVLAVIDLQPVVFDHLLLDPYYRLLSADFEHAVRQIPWGAYRSIFITTPSWFVMVPAEVILRLYHLVKGVSPRSEVYFFSNSLGSWTDEKKLTEHGIRIRHLNDLFDANPINEPVDYDSLPIPVYEKRDRYLFNILPFRLKHGCVWGQCRFCSLAKGWNSGYLERSIGKVIQEIEELIDRHNPQMFVCSDNSINGANLLDFCSAFESFKMPWAAMGRADLSNREIEALQRSGCRVLYFGLESGSDRVLENLNKGIDSRQMSRFVKSLADRGIMPFPSVFVGSPGETQADFDKTIEFLSAHRDYLKIVNLYPFMPSPASVFTRMGKRPHPDTIGRLQRLIGGCVDPGLKVCVGEQSAEYLLFKTVVNESNQGPPMTG